MTQRIVCWFSHGAASAVATKLAVEENRKSKNPKELVIACIHLENEHPDGKRFADECEKLFGQEIVYLRDKKYGADVDEVIRKTRYMSGVRGARCTKELKKQVRFDWQRDDDIHVFGMTAEEEHRVDQLIDGEPNLEIWAPLIDKGYSKSDCFKVVNDAGIELPEMYKLGYHNNNCIGCLKAAGAGYWNKIRVDFPDVFKRRAEQERLLNVALIKMSFAKYKRLYGDWYQKMIDDDFEPKVDSRGSMRLPLRYLPPEAGSHKDLDIGACGFFCEKPGDQYRLDL
ncbi:MAG: hypothetical protein Unbinned6284contig1001_45 [Prokaryotic dsDNA virus sp.]|nr:MAG: hypothetical protein Unbinned6284contig1001_45 [Prokaryotic dsDNA virus sp.]|tara:strand:+ start:6676 stop:7527 length:852 start_codon:yes stop_codon:yes gene_type:complete